MQLTDSQIQTAIIDILQDTIQDWDLEQDEINPKTQLVADLNFASIDIIHMVVSVEEHFKQKLGFNELLMHDGRYVDDLSVDQVVNFVSHKLRGQQ